MRIIPRMQTLSLLLVVSGLLLTPLNVLQTSTGAAAQEGMPTSRVDEGIYYVYATREGLVGGTTSSGYRIVQNDFFVSLPACTPQNCPRGTTRGNVTQCGDKCYVKVVNPVTNQCRVEPIKDIGPWFTVDDWWNPSDVRFLNQLNSNPQDLPQGYTAADAARNGLNIGYGVSSGGIGFDNTHQLANRNPRAVGNRAAIDLADGTWRNLRLTSPDSIGSRVFVHMLWQTGGNPAAEAANCGHQLNQRGGTLYPLPVSTSTPLPYPPPVSTVAVTPTASSYAIVQNTGGVGLRCRTAPSTGSSVISTLPEGTNVPVRGLPISDWVPITCNGIDGWASANYLKVVLASPTATPPVTVTPAATPAATQLPDSTSTPTPTADSTATEETEPSTPDASPTSTSEATTTPTLVPSPTPSPSLEPSPSPSSTVTPTSTPTVPATPIVGSAFVSGTGGAGLRCRSGPSTGAAVLTNLPERTSVQLRGSATAGWYPVKCGGDDGWVSASYLRVTQTPQIPPTATVVPTLIPSPTLPSSPTAQHGTVANTGGANVRCRSNPTTASNILTNLREGTIVEVRGPIQGAWYPVRCVGQNGFIHADYLKVVTTSETRSASLQPEPSTPTEPSQLASTVTPEQITAEAPATMESTEIILEQPAVSGSGWVVSDSGGEINCRALPSTDAPIISVLPHGLWIELRGEPVDGWQAVICDGQPGYVAAQYIGNELPPVVTEVIEPVVEADSYEESDSSTSAVPGSNPQFSGSRLSIASAWDDASGNGWAAADSSTESTWTGQQLTLDLGSEAEISGVRWMPGGGGGPELLTIQTSPDGTSWTTVDTFGDRDPYTWEGVWIGHTARYVRLVATHSSSGTTGSLAEVEVWGVPVPIAINQILAVVPEPAANWRGSVSRWRHHRGRINPTGFQVQTDIGRVSNGRRELLSSAPSGPLTSK